MAITDPKPAALRGFQPLNHQRVSSLSCILFFIKAPQPGKVKTRLAQTIGETHATRLYEHFVGDLLKLLQSLPYDVLIFYSPADEEPAIQQWLGNLGTFFAQVGNDLGDRLHYAFQTAFDLGYQNVLVIGSDSPDLKPEFFTEAFAALATHPAVIGPTQDGGYYTLGFTQVGFLPAVFQGIQWSTATVFESTLQILANHSLQVHQLPQWYDVDTLADLEQFFSRNQGSDSQTMQYLMQHQLEVLAPV